MIHKVLDKLNIMKKIILTFSIAFMVNTSYSQINKKDTVMVDTSRVEKMKTMPVDSTYSKMPVVPLHPKDTVYRKFGDDEDPKRFEHPK